MPDCITPRQGGSTPYYLFGTQRRYAYAFHGRPGGVPAGNRAAESKELGGLCMFDSFSDNEKKLALVGAAVGAFFLWKKFGKRKNPTYYNTRTGVWSPYDPFDDLPKKRKKPHSTAAQRSRSSKAGWRTRKRKAARKKAKKR